MKGKLPVTVVAGASGSGKSRLLAQLRAVRPSGERWALLSNSVTGSIGGDPTIVAPGFGGGPDVPNDQFFQVAGGCACCLAGLVFRTTLTRLLRAGPWGRLLIEVDAAGHPHAVFKLSPIDLQRLTGAPFAEVVEAPGAP